MPGLNWCQLINFWCHLIKIWGHVLLTTYQNRTLCAVGQGRFMVIQVLIRSNRTSWLQSIIMCPSERGCRSWSGSGPRSCSNQSLFGRTELLPRLFWTHVQLWRLEIEEDLAITDSFNRIVFIQGLIYNILVDDQLKCENLNKSSSVSFLFTLVPKLKIPFPPRGPKKV